MVSLICRDIYDILYTCLPAQISFYACALQTHLIPLQLLCPQKILTCCIFCGLHLLFPFASGKRDSWTQGHVMSLLPSYGN